MEHSKKIAKYITTSISGIFNSSKECDDIEVCAINSQDWSKEEECDETVVIKKSEYDKIIQEISTTRVQISKYKTKEHEYKRMKHDYDRTVSYLLENDKTRIICDKCRHECRSECKHECQGNMHTSECKHECNRNIHMNSMHMNSMHMNNTHMNSMHMNNTHMNHPQAAELRLKSHIKALKKDLFDAENKSEAYKSIAMNDIEVLKNKCNKLMSLLQQEKEQKVLYENKVKRLEEIIQNRCEENIELIEYCRYLL